jgi:hypothetical protein
MCRSDPQQDDIGGLMHTPTSPRTLRPLTPASGVKPGDRPPWVPSCPRSSTFVLLPQRRGARDDRIRARDVGRWRLRPTFPTRPPRWDPEHRLFHDRSPRHQVAPCGRVHSSRWAAWEALRRPRPAEEGVNVTRRNGASHKRRTGSGRGSGTPAYAIHQPTIRSTANQNSESHSAGLPRR